MSQMADKLIISALCHREGKTNNIVRGDTGDMIVVYVLNISGEIFYELSFF